MQASTIGFPMYRQFPVELRLKIIKEAVATRIEEALPDKASLALWTSSIHSDWNQVIEGFLFKTITIRPEEVQEFARICGPRHDLLRKISFLVWPAHLLMPATTHPAQVDHHKLMADDISRLFHVMKDWSPSKTLDRRLKLGIWIPANPGPRIVSSNSSDDFPNLPDVPAIGRLYLEAPGSFPVGLNHLWTSALHEKLPNLCSANISLPGTPLLRQIIGISRYRLIATHRVSPNLTKLSITRDRTLALVPELPVRGEQIRIARCVTPQLSLWRHTLVCLKLEGPIDPPQFLFTASTSLWPNLYRVDLAGSVDDDEIVDGGKWDSEVRADRDFVRGLLACLPSMPRLTTLSMCFLDGWDQGWTRSLCMDLGTRTNTERRVWQTKLPFDDTGPTKVPVTPCCPIPAGTCILKTYGISLPGHLVSELQDTVRRIRRLDLAVFRCSEALQEQTFLPPCAQWKATTETWEPAFSNDMDEFIYGMGEYWYQEQWVDYDSVSEGGF